jgi:plasmid stabilization system protein ParE
VKKVFWTPVAKKSLQQTVDFLTKQWNDSIVDEFLNQLDYRIVQIQKNPELAPVFINSEFRQLIIHKSVSLFYHNSSSYIKLLLVWDNRQDPVHLWEKLKDANSK